MKKYSTYRKYRLGRVYGTQTTYPTIRPFVFPTPVTFRPVYYPTYRTYRPFVPPTYPTFPSYTEPIIPDFKVPTFRPDIFTEKPPSTSSASWAGVLGAIVPVIVVIIWVAIKCRLLCNRRRQTVARTFTITSGVRIPSSIIEVDHPKILSFRKGLNGRKTGNDVINQPLISAEQSNIDSGQQAGINQGYVLGGHSVPQPALQITGDAHTSQNQQHGLPVLVVGDSVDLPNDPAPEPDPNNPYSVEAINGLVDLHRSRQFPAVRIVVHRETIVEDLIDIYSNMDQLQAHRSVFCKFEGEEGLDAGGVMKDLYTTFWDKAKYVYFKGNTACIPQINLCKYDLNLFVTLGRIFSHTTVLLRAVPIQICRTTLLSIISGEMEMGQDPTELRDLLEDFLLYLDLDDRLLLQKALNYFDDLDETELMKLQFIFETYAPQKETTEASTPQKETLEANLSIIAYNELYVKPRVVCQKMGQGIPDIHRDYFWKHLTLRHINALYDVFRPTPNKVIGKLFCERLLLSRNERRAFVNLKRFIQGLSEDLLLKFLQFITGERKIPCGVIIVRFTQLTGAARAPKSHTCINMLELPSSYTKYDDLDREFTNILLSEEAMNMNME